MAHRAPSGIAELRAVVVGSEPALSPITRGLRRTGIAVATSEAFTGYDAALDVAEAAVGQLGAAVWAATPAALTEPAEIVAIDEARWTGLVDPPMRAFIEFLQAIERRLRSRGGRIVVVVPTIAASGAANLVGWATVAEAQRAMAKSVARVWGANDITINCVAVPAALLAPAHADLDRPHLQQAALADPDLENDVAGVIAGLCGNGFGAVTGGTISVDGGRWIPS